MKVLSLALAIIPLLLETGYWANTPGHPNFVENVHFHINCRLSVRPLGHPNGLNPTVPRAPFKIPIFDRCAKSVFSLFCRLSVPSLGRPFHHFERQSFQCTSKLRFFKLALMPQALFFSVIYKKMRLVA